MTKYIKTVATKFEQFDGSQWMIEKYGIKTDQISITDGNPNIPVDEQYKVAEIYLLPTLKGITHLEVGDWIATGPEGEHYSINDRSFKQTYKAAQSFLQRILVGIKKQSQGDSK